MLQQLVNLKEMSLKNTVLTSMEKNLKRVMIHLCLSINMKGYIRCQFGVCQASPFNLNDGRSPCFMDLRFMYKYGCTLAHDFSTGDRERSQLLGSARDKDRFMVFNGQWAILKLKNTSCQAWGRFKHWLMERQKSLTYI